jgi:hypothetical protein
MLRDPARGPRSERSPTAGACLVAEDLAEVDGGLLVSQRAVERERLRQPGRQVRDRFGVTCLGAPDMTNRVAHRPMISRPSPAMTDSVFTRVASRGEMGSRPLRGSVPRVRLRLEAQPGPRPAEIALARGVVLQHATRGAQRAEDVARNNAHDAHHHLWDIDRILRAG